MNPLASQMENLPVISFQAGETIAWTRLPIIDMATFKLVAFKCQPLHAKELMLITSDDIRQLTTDCVIIDDETELINLKDIVRLQPIIEADYTPLNKPVFTETNHKLGSVEDYVINLETSTIQKLHVRQSLFRAWMGSSLMIDHTQIIDVTPQRITVREATVKTPIIQTDPIPEPRT